ncbi:MAG: flavin reductase [Mobilibacterium timonense]|uniref:flavin reductase n=1 Tax=Mobilibacterium timonense TaxID=1871012 RepID=UPI0023539A22|nr:flavin reductase [Mobilibacterium timonense]MBM6989936.1 flavin reductase [Mobilibacterium timonense]
MKEFEKEKYRVFEMFNKDWALVTAGDMDDFNSCTVGWGSLGSIWGHSGQSRPVATVYVHPARYTSEFLKKHDFFTVGFYDQKYKKALAYMGSHSGRNENKAEGAGLTPVAIGDGVTYEEAGLTFLCRKLYMHKFNKDDLAEEIKEYYAAQPKVYPNVTPDGTDDEWEPHFVIVGEIVESREKK